MHVEELFAVVFIVGMFAGVFIIFLGLRQRSLQLEMHHRERMAMMMIISVAGGNPEAGIGVGGAIAILGAAFIVRSIVVRGETPADPAASRTPVQRLPGDPL